MANRKQKSQVSNTSRKRNKTRERRFVPYVEGVFITNSPEETRELGVAFSKALGEGDVVFLSGDLGCGKTTLVQGIARGFGINDAVRSSSFMLANEYRSPRSRMTIYHIDLYRLEGETIDDFGLEEYIFGGGICVVEWADRIRRFPVTSAWEVTLAWLSENRRKLTFKRIKNGKEQRR